MYGLSDISTQKLTTLFRRYPAIEKAIIYGSRARGDNNRGSDIDITFTGETLTPDMLLRISNDIDDLLLPYYVDISLMNNIKNPALIDNIHKEGKIFYKNV